MDLGLPDRETKELEVYIGALNHYQIKLRERDDVLIWDADQSGKYTPKEGYIKLSVVGANRAEVWWWKTLWKINCPSKTRLFMWCVLENKTPCCDNLKKRIFQGLGWCIL